eukprot:3968528-Prymnesium_polylepis.2
MTPGYGSRVCENKAAMVANCLARGSTPTEPHLKCICCRICAFVAPTVDEMVMLDMRNGSMQLRLNITLALGREDRTKVCLLSCWRSHPEPTLGRAASCRSRCWREVRHASLSKSMARALNELVLTGSVCAPLTAHAMPCAGTRAALLLAGSVTAAPRTGWHHQRAARWWPLP